MCDTEGALSVFLDKRMSKVEITQVDYSSGLKKKM